MEIDVAKSRFAFPAGWQVSPYDEWAFYQCQFCKIRNGIKGVDLVAIHKKEVWLIEVKDYREHPHTQTLDLAEEVPRKVFDTLAALLPAKIHANKPAEKKFATQVLQGQSLRVILHLEQPRNPSKVFPRAIDPADVQQKLRKSIKPIDPHPKVVESDSDGGTTLAGQLYLRPNSVQKTQIGGCGL